MERNLPGVFNAAGLMVPDPSTSAAPIPFIDDVAGIGGAEYMVSGGRKLVVALTVAGRASARSRCALDSDDDYCKRLCGVRGLVALTRVVVCRQSAQVKLRTPLPGHYLTLKPEGGGGRVGKVICKIG